MEITWFGQSCCRLDDTNITIVTDPYDEETGQMLHHFEADVVAISHPELAKERGTYRIIDRPGEYEIQDVFITAITIHPPEAEAASPEERSSLIFVFEFEDLVICYLGRIRMVPSQQHIEGLESIDVLLIPVGGGLSLNAAQASELIRLIEPSIVIPIYYQQPGSMISLEPLDKFLKEMGQSQKESHPRLRIRRSNLPLELSLIHI